MDNFKRDGQRNMKALVVTNVFPNSQQPNYGIFIKQRIKEMSQFCEIKVVAPTPYFPPIKISKKWYLFSKIPAREIYEDIKLFHPRWFVFPKIGTNISGVSFFFSIIGVIKKIQREFDFDLIDAHCIYPDGVGAVLAAKFLKKPIVLSARGTDINLYTQYPLVRKQIIATLNNADKIIAVSEALKNKINELGIDNSKIITIPNGIDTYRFRPLSKIEARKKLNLPFEKKIILSIGNLIEGKGFHHIINALDKIKKKEDILLVIIGEGEYRKKIERLIKVLEISPYIKLVGAKPHEEIPWWYNAADIFCLYSQREGCPNVLLESLACGLPIIATDVGGIREIITSQDIGIILKHEENSEELREAILEGLRRKWETKKLIEAVKNREWQKVGEKIFNVFKSIMWEKKDENSISSSHTSNRCPGNSYRKDM